MNDVARGEWDGRVDWSDRFWSKVHPEALSGCWLWHATTDVEGYGWHYHDGRRTSAHRYAHTMAFGAPGRLFVCHRCDVPSCVNPAHLFAGTPRDNTRDMILKGRRRPIVGERHHAAVLTPDAVRSIRAAHDEGASICSIANALGVARCTVYKVVHRITWRHVDALRGER